MESNIRSFVCRRELWILCIYGLIWISRIKKRFSGTHRRILQTFGARRHCHSKTYTHDWCCTRGRGSWEAKLRKFMHFWHPYGWPLNIQTLAKNNMHNVRERVQTVTQMHNNKCVSSLCVCVYGASESVIWMEFPCAKLLMQNLLLTFELKCQTHMMLLCWWLRSFCRLTQSSSLTHFIGGDFWWRPKTRNQNSVMHINVWSVCVATHTHTTITIVIMENKWANSTEWVYVPNWLQHDIQVSLNSLYFSISIIYDGIILFVGVAVCSCAFFVCWFLSRYRMCLE